MVRNTDARESSTAKIDIYTFFCRKIKPLIDSELIIDIETEKDPKLTETINKLSLNRP